MKGHVKRAIELLESVGFELDTDASHFGNRVYRHANSPDEPLKIFSGASEPACITVMHKAQRIADTGWSGPAMPRTIGERNREQKAQKKRRVQREIREHAERGAKAEEHYQSWQAIEAADRHRREIERLMMPGR